MIIFIAMKNKSAVIVKLMFPYVLQFSNFVVRIIKFNSNVNQKSHDNFFMTNNEIQWHASDFCWRVPQIKQCI